MMSTSFFARCLSAIAFSVSVTLLSCNQDDKLVTVMPPSGEAYKDTVEQLFAAFNRHDWPAFAGYYKDTAQFLDPEFGPAYVLKTRGETIAKYSEMQSMFPDVRDSLTNIFADGESVMAEFISTGTAPDGTKWSLPIVSVFRFRHGKIERDATYYDMEMTEPPVK